MSFILLLTTPEHWARYQALVDRFGDDPDLAARLALLGDRYVAQGVDDPGMRALEDAERVHAHLARLEGPSLGVVPTPEKLASVVRRPARRWTTMLAMAAGLVLGVGLPLLLRTGEQAGQWRGDQQTLATVELSTSAGGRATLVLGAPGRPRREWVGQEIRITVPLGGGSDLFAWRVPMSSASNVAELRILALDGAAAGPQVLAAEQTYVADQPHVLVIAQGSGGMTPRTLAERIGTGLLSEALDRSVGTARFVTMEVVATEDLPAPEVPGEP